MLISTNVVINHVRFLSTPLDVVSDNISLLVPEIGNLIVLYQSGTYGYTAIPHQF